MNQTNNIERKDVYFVDIGANIGTFSIAMAMAGYSVIAFESMRINQQALRLSICANNIVDRFTVFNVALGKESTNCTIFSHPSNTLNGNILCGPNPNPIPGYG